MNFANTKKVLEKRLIFVLFFGGTNFIQKINSLSKYRPRLMKLSETHDMRLRTYLSWSGKNLVGETLFLHGQNFANMFF